MPKKCCVPGCKSNYRTSRHEGYVTVFGFPTNESVRDKWLHSIGRDNWLPSRKSVVCVKHFIDSDVTRVEVYKDKNGVVKQYPRHRPMLRPEAVPKIFLSSSSHQRFNHAPKRSFGESPRTDLPLFIGERNEKWSLETSGSYNDKDELVCPESVILVPGGDMDESESEGGDDDDDDNSIFNYDLDPLDVDNYTPQDSKSDVHENVVLSKFGDLSVEEPVQRIAPWILDHSYVKTVPPFIASNTIESGLGSSSTDSSIKNHTPRSERGIVRCTPGPKKGTKEAIVRGKIRRSDTKLPLSKSFPISKIKLSGKHSSLQNGQHSRGRAKFITGKVSKKLKRGETKISCRTPEDINRTIELKASTCNSKIQESSQGIIFGKGTMQSNKKVRSNAIERSESFSEKYEEIDLEADENCKSDEVRTTRSSKILEKCNEKSKSNSQVEDMEMNEHLMQITNAVEKQDKQVRMEAFPDIVKQSINSVQEANVKENIGEEHTMQRLGTIGEFAAKSRGKWNRKCGRGRGRKDFKKSLSGRVGEDCDKNKTTRSSILDIRFTPKTLHRRTSSRIVIPDKKMVGPNGKSVGAAVSQKEKGVGVKLFVHSSFSPRVVIERNLNLRSDRKTTQGGSDNKSPSLDTISSSSSINDKNGMVSSKHTKVNATLSKDIPCSMSNSVIHAQQGPKERCGVPVGLTSRRRGHLRANGRFRQVTKRKVTSTEKNVTLKAKSNDQITETATVVGPIELCENNFTLRVTRSSSEKRRNEVNENSEKEEKATVSAPDTCDNRQKGKLSLKVVEPETTSATLTKLGECESAHENEEKSIEVDFAGSKTSMQLPSSRENSLGLGEKNVLGRRRRRRRRGRGVSRGKSRGGLNSLLSSQEKTGTDAIEQNIVSSPNRAVCGKSDSGNNAVLTVEQEASLNGNVGNEEDGVCKMNDLPLDICNNGPIIVHVSSLRSETDILKHVNSDLEFISDSSEDDIPIIMDIMSLSEESEESNSSEIFSQAESYDQVTDDIGKKSLLNKVDEENSSIAGAAHDRKYCNSVLPDPCPYCRMHFADAFTALTHSRSCSKSLTRHVISCHVCDRLYVQIEDLEAHMKIHQKEILHMCIACKVCFDDIETFNEHMTVHTQS